MVVVQAGQGPLNTPSFTTANTNGGVIDIPTSAYITIDANGPDVVLTAQLTGVPLFNLQLLSCIAKQGVLSFETTTLSSRHARPLHAALIAMARWHVRSPKGLTSARPELSPQLKKKDAPQMGLY